MTIGVHNGFDEKKIYQDQNLNFGFIQQLESESDIDNLANEEFNYLDDTSSLIPQAMQ